MTAALLSACRGAPERPAEEKVPSGTILLTPAQVQSAGIQVDTVRFEMISLPLTVPATLETPEPLSARVGSIVEGRVDDVLVLPGDKVARGAPLMHIHSHELATAVRDFASAEAQLSVAQAAYDRSQRLLADEAVPREEVERRLGALDQARAEYARSREVVDHMSPSPQGDVTVRATRAGTVFAVHVRAGTVVTPGTPLVDLGDESQLWATGFVPEHAAVLVRPGTLVAITVDAIPDTIRAASCAWAAWWIRSVARSRCGCRSIASRRACVPACSPRWCCRRAAVPRGSSCPTPRCSGWPMATWCSCRRPRVASGRTRCERCRWMAAAWRWRA